MVHVYVGSLLFSHCSDALRLADAHMIFANKAQPKYGWHEHGFQVAKHAQSQLIESSNQAIGVCCAGAARVWIVVQHTVNQCAFFGMEISQDMTEPSALISQIEQLCLNTNCSNAQLMLQLN